MHGISPPILLTTQQGASNAAPFAEASQIPIDRKILREVFSPNAARRWGCSPFRVAFNAGDLYSRQTAPGGSNQVKGRTRIYNLLSSDGVTKGDGASGNQHFVYDSSDYVRYLRLKAKNQNYDDSSFGGTTNSSYEAIMRVTRR